MMCVVCKSSSASAVPARLRSSQFFLSHPEGGRRSWPGYLSRRSPLEIRIVLSVLLVRRYSSGGNSEVKKGSSQDIYYNSILSKHDLRDIFDSGKDFQNDKIKQLLIENDQIYTAYLKSLLDEEKHGELQAVFEKFGMNNNMKGEAPVLYLKSFLVSKTHPEKLNILLSNQKNRGVGDTQSFPLYIHLSQSKLWLFLQILGLLLWMAALYLLLFSKGGGGNGLSGMLDGEYKPVSSKKNITFDDVIGNVEAKEDMQDLVEYLKNPQRFEKVRVPKGILLVGPPGTGKTLLARALAGEADVPFIVASGSEFEEVFVGLGARRIRQLFEEARKQAPCIVFIDEIDALAGSRDKSIFKNNQMSLNQLLVELDGFVLREGIILIGATNMPKTLDPALVRPGRFDRKIHLRLPNTTERQQMLQHYLQKHSVAPEVHLEVLSKQLTGMSGADIENLVNWAAIESIKKDLPSISMKQLEQAILNVIMGREKKSLVLSDHIKKMVAYHEGGHAITALFTPGAAEIREATLVPRGDALGMVNFLDDEDSMLLQTRKELFATMVTAMGGTVAEKMVFGEGNVTSGASSDIEAATRVAKMMVTLFGMSEKIGHMHIEENSNIFGQSDGLPVVAQEEIKRLVEEAYKYASELLKQKEPELHRLATALLKYESLEKEEIIKVIKGEDLTDKVVKDEIAMQISQSVSA